MLRTADMEAIEGSLSLALSGFNGCSNEMRFEIKCLLPIQLEMKFGSRGAFYRLESKQRPFMYVDSNYIN